MPRDVCSVERAMNWEEEDLGLSSGSFRALSPSELSFTVRIMRTIIQPREAAKTERENLNRKY